ncbi:CheY-like superfamily [Paraphysoderma sedebokerense]|nr:CheY-like superfamily [Paraphysoderma sedebokerense]
MSCRVVFSAEILTILDLRELKIFSVGQSSKGKTFGSPGLSFYIVKQLSNKLHGGVSISAINSSVSVVNVNEPFKTQLEVVVDIPVSKNMQSPEPRLGSGVSNIDLKRKPTVLVAEDNPIVQAMTKKMVTKCGFPVVTANDGQQAVDLVRQLYNHNENDRLGIILMDLIMPNVSGYEAAESIRHKLNIQVSELPIIAVTANTLEEEKRKCLQSGNFDEFITKPVSIATLRRVLDTWSTKLSIDNT